MLLQPCTVVAPISMVLSYLQISPDYGHDSEKLQQFLDTVTGKTVCCWFGLLLVCLLVTVQTNSLVIQHV